MMGCGGDENDCGGEVPTLEEAIAERNTDNLPVQTFDVPNSDISFQYIIVAPGDAQRPSLADSVTVNYRGSLTDLTQVFDETNPSGDEPDSFGLGGLIPGWQLGIPLIGEGGEIILFLPSELAYGARGVPESIICPGADLVFDIELVGIIN